jgi:hypothetical protein
MRVALTLAVFAILVLGCPNALANTIILNIDSGHYQNNGLHVSGNYIAGLLSGVTLHDYFSFDLSGISDPVTAATFDVYSQSIAGAGTYSVYATSLAPSQVDPTQGGSGTIFIALTAGSVIGSIPVTSADSNRILSIPLNGSGLSWLTAYEGSGIVMGGALVPSSGDAIIFGFTDFNAANKLDIDTEPLPPEGGSVPEPSTVLMLGAGLLGVVRAARRRRAA